MSRGKEQGQKEDVPPRPLKAFTGNTAPDVQDIDWLLPRFLARGAGTILAGQPGVSKTVHAAILCAYLWQGYRFAGLEVRVQHARILYVDVEKGWNWTAPYFNAAFRGAGIEGLPPEFHYWSPKTEACRYDDESGFAALETMGEQIADYVRAHGIDLVVIDSLGQFITGDQNNAQDVSLGFRMGLNPITTAGAAVLVIDHTTKGSMQGGTFAPTPAGSQQKRAWAVVSVILEREGEQGEGRVRWTVDKTNAEPFTPFVTKLDFQSDSNGRLETITLEHEGDAGDRGQSEKVGGELAARRTILEALATGEQKRGQFARGGTFDRSLKDLLEAGEITKSTRGVYSLPDSESSDGPRDAHSEFAPPHHSLGVGVVVQTPRVHLEDRHHVLNWVQNREFAQAVSTPLESIL